MKPLVENFGIIQARVSTPYTRFVKNYIDLDWDIVGIYYPNNNGLELILYDAYTSSRIRDITSIGELLVWESLLEISTKKFYYEFSEEELNEAIAAIIVTNLEPIE